MAARALVYTTAEGEMGTQRRNPFTLTAKIVGTQGCWNRNHVARLERSAVKIHITRYSAANGHQRHTGKQLLGRNVDGLLTRWQWSGAAPAPGQFVEPFLPPWLMLVNVEGKRFIPEMSSYSISGYAVNEQPGATAWAIFDEQALKVASHDIRHLDPYGSGTNLPTWEEHTIRERVTNGDVLIADSLEALASARGIDYRALAHTVAQYNRDCEAGRDSHFMQAEEKTFPIATGPFYACKVLASVIGVTGAGLDIDRDCRVLDEAGIPIDGLYAAGEVLGVIMGKRYAGGGMSIGPAVVLGRRAGTNAAHAPASPVTAQAAQ